MKTANFMVSLNASITVGASKVVHLRESR